MSRILYTTIDQVRAKLPQDFVIEALDDDGDGIIDDAVWEAVAGDAADQVDARLGQRYTVPFSLEDLPATAKTASLIFVCETLFQRRGHGTEEDNPFLIQARNARMELGKIGAGEKPLTATAKRPTPSVAFFKEPARTNSGSLST